MGITRSRQTSTPPREIYSRRTRGTRTLDPSIPGAMHVEVGPEENIEIDPHARPTTPLTTSVGVQTRSASRAASAAVATVREQGSGQGRSLHTMGSRNSKSAMPSTSQRSSRRSGGYSNESGDPFRRAEPSTSQGLGRGRRRGSRGAGVKASRRKVDDKEVAPKLRKTE